MGYKSNSSVGNLSPTGSGPYVYTFTLPAGTVEGDLLVINCLFQTASDYGSFGPVPTNLVNDRVINYERRQVSTGYASVYYYQLAAEDVASSTFSLSYQVDVGTCMALLATFTNMEPYLTCFQNVSLDPSSDPSPATSTWISRDLQNPSGAIVMNTAFFMSDINGTWSFSSSATGTVVPVDLGGVSHASTKGGIKLTMYDDSTAPLTGDVTLTGTCAGATSPQRLTWELMLRERTLTPRWTNQSTGSGTTGEYVTTPGEGLLIQRRSVLLAVNLSRRTFGGKRDSYRPTSDIAGNYIGLLIAHNSLAYSNSMFVHAEVYQGFKAPYIDLIEAFQDNQDRTSIQNLGQSPTIFIMEMLTNERSQVLGIEWQFPEFPVQEASVGNSSSDYVGGFTLPQANPLVLKTKRYKPHGLAIMACAWTDSGVSNIGITPPSGYTALLTVQDTTGNGVGGMVAYKIVKDDLDNGGAFSISNSSGSNRGWSQTGVILSCPGAAYGSRFRP